MLGCYMDVGLSVLFLQRFCLHRALSLKDKVIFQSTGLQEAWPCKSCYAWFVAFQMSRRGCCQQWMLREGLWRMLRIL